MIAIDQTNFYDPDKGTRGNCQQAAVASLLELLLSEVPNFIEGAADGGDQHRRFVQFFRARGLYLIRLPGNYIPDCFYLADGPAARGVHHMCVYRSGKLAHDPHPSRAGLISIDNIYVPVLAEPSRWQFQPSD